MAISFRSQEIEDKLNSYCENRNLKKSEVIRLALSAYLDESNTNEEITYEEAKSIEFERVKICVRLTKTEIDSLDILSHQMGLDTKQQLIIRVIRSLLTNGDILTQQEINSFKDLSVLNRRIGQTLNQMLKNFHTEYWTQFEDLSAEKIASLIQLIDRQSLELASIVKRANRRTKIIRSSLNVKD